MENEIEYDKSMEEDSWPVDREETGAAVGGQVGGAVGQSIGTAYGGPIGGVIGKYIGEKVGSYIGDKAEDAVSEQIDSLKDKDGGSCSNGSSDGQYSSSDGQCHETPEAPHYKLEIEENKYPENWWDKLPDFDPRVYDAIAMEQAAACVKYIFSGMPDVHELEHLIEARKDRKICPQLKVCVPRTKVIKPKEIKYETVIDAWVKKDQTY